MEVITESAFAKINLTLDVLDKRADGYHNIRSIMQTISLRDDVVLNIDTDAPWAVHCYREVIVDPKAEQSEVRLETDGFPQDADNLAWKAAETFFARTGKQTTGLEIFINKRIPTEAGLGGGSADAAAMVSRCPSRRSASLAQRLAATCRSAYSAARRRWKAVVSCSRRSPAYRSFL